MYIYFLVSWIFQKEIRHKKRWEFVFCWWHFPILCVVESYLAEPNYRKRSQNPQIPIIWGSKLCGKLCSDFIIRFVSLCYSCSIISACHEIDSTILQNKHSRNILWKLTHIWCNGSLEIVDWKSKMLPTKLVFPRRNITIKLTTSSWDTDSFLQIQDSTLKLNGPLNGTPKHPLFWRCNGHYFNDHLSFSKSSRKAWRLL